MSDDFFAELQQEFLTESSFLLDQYEEGMLALEGGNAAEEVMAQIFRVAHSIKGGAAAVGFTDLSQFAHVAEDLLAHLRVHPDLVSPDCVSLLLESGDVFRSRIKELQAGNPGEWDVSELKSRLVQKLKELEGVGDAPAPAPAPAAPEAPVPFEMPAPAPVEEDPCNHELLAELMAQMGGGAEASPAAAPGASAPAEPVLSVIPTPAPAAAPIPAAKSAAPAKETKDPVKPKASPPAGGSGNGGSIKVDISRVDSVLDAVGEIVVLKNQLVHDDLVRDGEHPRISAIVDQLDKLVRELYDKTLSIRMTPLKTLFLKIQRLVRDVSLQLGKPVNLQLEGEDTEVERTVAEILGDPLVHLVRNAMDHGIEKPEIRQQKGKPATASLTVSARQAGGTVVIEIIDDGGGISREKVLKKAIDKGLIPPGRDPDSLRDEEVFQFIFAPGFSTAEKVSDLSGRGVGLDVVRSNLERVQGKIEITSKPDIGTTFRLNIPLSTAITDGILVTAGASKYILPIHSISEIVRVVPADYTDISGHGRVVNIRDSLIPVIESGRVFGKLKHLNLEAGSAESSKETLRARRGETMLIIIESLKGKAAFPVDDVLGQAQVVVKPIQAGAHIPEVAGAAILGDGKTVLILDPQSLVSPPEARDASEAEAA